MYQPPTDDYEFLLRHVIDGSRILEVTTAGEVKIGDATDILSGAAALAVESWHPLNSIGDRLGNTLAGGVVVTPPGTIEAYRTLADAGWAGVAVPKSAGGEGLPWIVANALNEIWSAANVALSLSMGLSVAAIAAIDSSADEHLRSTYLPAMVAGRWTGTMNLTEPQAGTDLAGIRAMARPNDDGSWAVKGQKIFITWGDHDLTENIVHLVLARTPDAPEGLGGLSLFLVPMFVVMNITRVGTGVQGLGVSDRAYQQARDYADERIQGRVIDRPEGAPIAEHPDVARQLASMASVVSAMRGLSVQVGEWLDLAPTDSQAARLAEFFVPVLKGWFTETSLEVTTDAVQVHGGAGFIEETGIAQHYRDARILPIFEGTTAIQAKDLVGRKVLRDNGATADAALSSISATVDVLRQTDHQVATRTAQRLDRAITSLRRSTRTLLQFGEARRKRDAYAGSVAYLLS